MSVEQQKPKRWLIEETLVDGSTRWTCVEHEHQARAEAEGFNAVVSPLYAAPPAPSVAVKALPTALASMERHLKEAIEEHGVGSRFSWIEKDIRDIRLALSAQVQDVEGWTSGVNEAIAVADSEAEMWGHEAGSSARTVAARLRTMLAAAPAAKQERKT